MISLPHRRSRHTLPDRHFELIALRGIAVYFLYVMAVPSGIIAAGGKSVEPFLRHHSWVAEREIGAA